MKRKYFLISILTALCFQVSHSQTNAYTLKSTIELALANNLTVKQADLKTTAAKENVRQATYNRLPSISGGLNYGINNGRSIDPFTNSYNNQQLTSSNGSITASLPLFQGFKNQAAIQQTSLSHKAAGMEAQQSKDNLTLDVIQAFLQVLSNEDQLLLLKKQASVTDSQVVRLTLLNQEGAIAPPLLADLKGQYAADRVAVLNAENALESAKLSLATLMNIDYNKEMTFSREGLDMTPVPYNLSAIQVYRAAIEKMALVKAVDLRSAAALKAVKLAAADYYPTLSLFGQLNSNYSSLARTLTAASINEVPSGDFVNIGTGKVPVITMKTDYNSNKIGYIKQLSNNINTYFGVSLQVPIFSGFQARTRVSLARIEAKNSGFIAADTKRQLKQSVDKAFLDMQTAFDRLNLLQQQVNEFRESFRAAGIRFELGSIHAVEYLTVKNNLDRGEINLSVVKYEYLLRTKVLDFYQGTISW